MIRRRPTSEWPTLRSGHTEESHGAIAPPLLLALFPFWTYRVYRSLTDTY